MVFEVNGETLALLPFLNGHHTRVRFTRQYLLYVICYVGEHLDDCEQLSSNSSKLFQMIRDYFTGECSFDAWLAHTLRYAMFQIKDETYAKKIVHYLY